MTWEEHTRNIHQIRAKIQNFDDDFYAQENWDDPVVFKKYESDRQLLLDELEAAFAAQSAPSQ